MVIESFISRLEISCPLAYLLIMTVVFYECVCLLVYFASLSYFWYYTNFFSDNKLIPFRSICDGIILAKTLELISPSCRFIVIRKEFCCNSLQNVGNVFQTFEIFLIRILEKVINFFLELAIISLKFRKWCEALDEHANFSNPVSF